MGRTLALLTRTLREDVRQVRLPLAWLLLLLITLWMLALAHLQMSSLGAPGFWFFMLMSFLNAALITLMGISHFATPITEEKEEMTLGLLKMAGISPLALLLGKSVSRQLAAILALTIQFPFTLLAITLGGVLLHQVITAYVALLAYTLFLSNMGLFFSVVCKRSGRVSTILALLLLCLYFGPPLGQGIVEELVRYGYLSRDGLVKVCADTMLGGLLGASVFTQLYLVWNTGMTLPVVGLHFIINVAAAALFFALSWLTFDYFTRNEAPPDPETPMIVFRKRRSSRRSWSRAVVWKDFCFVMGGPVMFAVKFAGYLFLIGFFYYLNYVLWSYGANRNGWKEFGWTAVGVAFWGLGIECSLVAARVFRHEIRAKTLPTIAMLPRSMPRLAYAKVGGCLVGLIPGLFWLLAGAALDPEWINKMLTEEMAPEPSVWYFASLTLLFLHLVAYFSLHVKWGALPLGFVLVYFVGTLLMMTAFLLAEVLFGFVNKTIFGVKPEDLVFGGLTVLMLATTVLLHVRIGRRLVVLVGQ